MGPIFRWVLGYHYTLVDRIGDAEVQAAWLSEHAADLPYTAQLRGLLAAIDGRSGEAVELLSHMDVDALDGHHTFHLAKSYAMAGEHEHAIALLDHAMTLGFYPHDYCARLCPFFEDLRGRADFAAVLRRTADLTARFQV